jgi:hypothetical protein
VKNEKVVGNDKAVQATGNHHQMASVAARRLKRNRVCDFKRREATQVRGITTPWDKSHGYHQISLRECLKVEIRPVTNMEHLCR